MYFTKFYRPGIAFQKQCFLLAFTCQEENPHCFYTLFDLIVQSQDPAVIGMTGKGYIEPGRTLLWARTMLYIIYREENR